ncbi:MATE family efflux transporter [Faecalibacterium sp. An121]|uniref:MATE family efflux transporter n=1 Tax=Faecalibacterium sp. An121 TaxID=1965550 RepID=UPI000B36D9AA|nr:MATE family efflux transporter [Faecalibacterium sp. An121]OUQ36018.1 MATE family efflux transporter [Faecalibacterium sp. An121]
MRHSSEIDMCSGPLVGNLLRFSLPLMASGILQLLFNAADIIVLGQFASSSAMAAVGATSSLNSLMVNLFLGLSIGCSVVMAHSYGAQDWRRVQDTVHTAILLALFCGAALILLGLPLLPVLLGWMDTPADLMDQSVLYMRIVFLGMPAMMAYDFGAGILRAIGDTRRPLFFLTAAGITNACLNVFFVLVFHMDVAGVALATSISQYLSAGLILRCLARPGTRYQLHPRQLRLHKATLLQILRVGLPAGIQSVVFSVSNVLIQSSINSFGTLAVAGSTAAANIENFVYTAMESVYQAALNFTSQNIGAGKKERVPLILRDCLLLVAVIGAILGGLAVLFGRQLLSIYTSDPQVLPYGIDRIHVVCLTYLLCGLMDVACGVVRGMGAAVTPTVVSLTGACGLRIVWIFTVFGSMHSLFVLYLSYPVTWIVTFTMHMVCFVWFYRRLRRSGAATLHTA